MGGGTDKYTHITGGTDTNKYIIYYILLYISKGWGGRTNILIYHISGGTDTNKYITYIILYILIAKTGGDGQFQNRDTTTHTQTDRHHFGFLIEIQ